jgi:hypothetical protein
MLVQHYEWTGFDVLAITDHSVWTVEPSAERLLVLAGAEPDAGRMKGSVVNAGRLGNPVRSEVLDVDHRGLVTAARLGRPAFAPYGRLEFRDAAGGRAWANPLWIG